MPVSYDVEYYLLFLVSTRFKFLNLHYLSYITWDLISIIPESSRGFSYFLQFNCFVIGSFGLNKLKSFLLASKELLSSKCNNCSFIIPISCDVHVESIHMLVGRGFAPSIQFSC